MTEPFYQDDYVQLLHGDCLAVLQGMADDSVDAIVTDPPYGLEFMGKEWDRFQGKIPGRGARIQEERSTEMTPTGKGHVGSKGPYLAARVDQFIAGTPYQAWCEEWARECLRVIKPGGYLLAFGGTRTVHRLACAIEDAGWEIRDCLVWGYANGFPKSLDVSKAIDKAAGADREVVGRRTDGRYAYGFTEEAKKALGATVAAESESGFSGEMGVITAPATDLARQWAGWGTALKPAWEPIVMARKPLVGTVAANVSRFGTGALNIGATRIGTNPGYRYNADRNGTTFHGEQNGRTEQTAEKRGADVIESSTGRWPSNVMLTDAIYDGAYADEVVGGGQSTSTGHFPSDRGPSGMFSGDGGGLEGDNPEERYLELGGKSRFFLVPKADRAERERGLVGESSDAGMHNGKRRLPDQRERSPHDLPQRVNTHPTVKPIDLMRHLVRLVTPPHGIVLDPFIGSGTTALAASEEGFHCIGIDQSSDYLDIAIGRLSATPIGLGL